MIGKSERNGAKGKEVNGTVGTNVDEFAVIGGKMCKLGPVMPGVVKPVHVGWYRRSYYFDGVVPENATPDYWDGSAWQVGSSDGRALAKSPWQYLPWRGLAQPYDDGTSQDHPGPLGLGDPSGNPIKRPRAVLDGYEEAAAKTAREKIIFFAFIIAAFLIVVAASAYLGIAR